MEKWKIETIEYKKKLKGLRKFNYESEQEENIGWKSHKTQTNTI